MAYTSSSWSIITRSSAPPRSLSWILSSFLLLCLFSSSSLALKAAIDPSELAAGSRPLGMGRAFSAVADDAYAIFQNPAGLAGIGNLQVASMYSKVIDEVDYSLLGVIHSMSREALGLGYVQAQVGGSLWSKRDPITNRIVPDSSGAISYQSSVLFFSYGVRPDKYLTWPYLEQFELGANFKLFNQALTGLPTEDVSAIGFDLDLGVKYHPLSWLKLGVAGYNILPYSMGGRLIWGTNITESIPASLKAGWALKILGQDGLREVFSPYHELTLSHDIEMAPTSPRPALNHLGLEWKLNQIFTLRGGIDQDYSMTATESDILNNLSIGLGLSLFNFRFDYAFHTFNELLENNSHFVSLTYGIEPQPSAPYLEPKEQVHLSILEPAERTVFYAPYAVIKGRINDPASVKKVLVGETEANLYPDNTFFVIAQLLKYGKNRVELKAFGPTGRLVETRPVMVLRLPVFSDLPDGHPLRQTVGGLVILGYLNGYPDGTFGPDRDISRAELCKVLTLIKGWKQITAPIAYSFKDVSYKNWAYGYINRAVEEQLVVGYPDRTFRPNRGLTRAEAIKILVGFEGLQKKKLEYERPFPDVELKHWAAGYILAAKEAGFLVYLKGKDFEPNRPITRGEIVDILAKTGAVKNRLSELFDR